MSEGSLAGRAERLRTLHRGTFGRPPQVVACAPGRVNLIGEHTDYNEGWVLPVAIDRWTFVSASRRPDGKVYARSLNAPGTAFFDLADIRPSEKIPWSNYVRGILAELVAGGIVPRGADLFIESDVPIGSGLSSSASLEVASALAVSRLAGKDIPPADLARLCQKAENGFVGVRCGIMDPMASACAREGHALLVDCRDLSTRHVSLEALSDARIVVVDSGIRHRLSDISADGYNRRREECEEGVRILSEADAGIRALRDASAELVEAQKGKWPEAVHRRCRYVVQENARVLSAVDAVESGDAAALGTLMNASHADLRDLYEVSLPAIDALAAAAQSAPGCLGSRLTGAGFGGCTVSLVREDGVEGFARLMEEAGRRAGLAPRVHACRAVGGARMA